LTLIDFFIAFVWVFEWVDGWAPLNEQALSKES